MQSTRPRALRADTSSGEPERHFGQGSITWAEGVLRDQEMPSQEIRAVVTSADPELVRRYLELHLERLDERHRVQRRAVAEIERLLAERRDDGWAKRSPPSGSGEPD